MSLISAISLSCGLPAISFCGGGTVLYTASLGGRHRHGSKRATSRRGCIFIGVFCSFRARCSLRSHHVSIFVFLCCWSALERVCTIPMQQLAIPSSVCNAPHNNLTLQVNPNLNTFILPLQPRAYISYPHPTPSSKPFKEA